jgi:hypothetical protein
VETHGIDIDLAAVRRAQQEMKVVAVLLRQRPQGSLVICAAMPLHSRLVTQASVWLAACVHYCSTRVCLVPQVFIDQLGLESVLEAHDAYMRKLATFKARPSASRVLHSLAVAPLLHV